MTTLTAQEIALSLGLSWPPPTCACSCGQAVEMNRAAAKWRKWVTGHSPKPSVAEIDKFYSPLEILHLAKKAYEWPSINDDDRLEHAAYVATANMGAFRVGETLSLMKHMFKRMKSLENVEFLVVEAVIVEKSGGKMRNVALYLKDPLITPLVAHLENLPVDAKVFDISDQTGINIAKRVTGDERATNHWFREQRNTWWATGFNKDERNKMVGWSHHDKGKEKQRRMRQKDMADRYEFMNWMWYADRLAKLTDRYWEANPPPSEVVAWMESIKARQPTDLPIPLQQNKE